MATPKPDVSPADGVTLAQDLLQSLNVLKSKCNQIKILRECIQQLIDQFSSIFEDIRPSDYNALQSIVNIIKKCENKLSADGWEAPNISQKIAIAIENFLRVQHEMPFMAGIKLPSYSDLESIFQNGEKFGEGSKRLDAAFLAYTVAKPDSEQKRACLLNVDKAIQEWIAAKPAAQSFMHHPDLAMKSARGPAVILLRELVQAELLKPENVAALASQAQREVAASIQAIKRKLGDQFNRLLGQLLPEINRQLSDEMAVKLNSALKALLPYLKGANPREVFIKFANLLMRECPELAAGDVLTLANWKMLQPSGLKPGYETAEIEKAFTAYEREQTPANRDILQKSLSAWLEAKHENKNSKRRDVVELFSQLAQHVAKPAPVKEEKSEARQDYALHRMRSSAMK